MNKVIRIEITAPAHSGKSHIASSINNMLNNIGFTDVKVLNPEEALEVFQNMYKNWVCIKEQTGSERLLNIPVEIVQTNISRDAEGAYTIERVELLEHSLEQVIAHLTSEQHLESIRGDKVQAVRHPTIAALEILPVTGDGNSFITQFDGPDANTVGWSVYAVNHNGEAVWMHDRLTEIEAETIANESAKSLGVEVKPRRWIKTED